MNMKEYIKETYTLYELEAIIQLGCAKGAAFKQANYEATELFHDKFEVDVWGLIDSRAETAEMEFFQFIGNLKGSEEVGGIDQFKRLLCWFAIEETAREIINGGQEDE